MVTAAISSIFSRTADITASFARKFSTYILKPKLFHQPESVCVWAYNMGKNFPGLLRILLIIVAFYAYYL